MGKILIVDDSKAIRCMLSNVLTNHGHTVLEAGDGKEGAEMAEGSAFDLIITDVHMPEMNGLELVKKLRETADHRFTPIVFLTTECNDEFKAKGRAAGATAWITKPFSPVELLAVVNKVAPK